MSGLEEITREDIADICDQRVHYGGAHYCLADYKKEECKYMDIMQTGLITQHNNVPIYAIKCTYVEKLISEWFED